MSFDPMGPTIDSLVRSAMEAHRAGDFAEAERLCRSAISIDDCCFKAWVHLSVLERNKGDFADSIPCAERAIALQPNSSDGYIQMGLALLGSGQPQKAIDFFRQAIAISPNLSPIHYNLGLALENVGQVGPAIESFLQASRLSPQDVRARISLGSLLLRGEDLIGARNEAELAMKLNPTSPEAHLFMAKVLIAEEKGAAAEKEIYRALELDPQSSYGHSMLGFRLLRTGDFDGAENAFKKSIELDPAQGLAFFGITQARKIVDTDRPLVDQMLAALQGAPLTLEQVSYLEFGLGKAYDNLGEYEKAMHHFDQAHRNTNLLRYSPAPFDEAEYARDIEAIKSLYDEELLSEPPRGFSSELPIFIVGMMRSGTTLTEQILSSHRRVGAAGEQWYWAKRGHLAENLETGKFDQAQAVVLAREYCRQLRQISPNTDRVTDKLPGNYLRLGFLSRAMPNAKIIHCRRNPLDTSLSIYFTANPVAPAYTHSKEHIAYVYRKYLDLMDHWRAVLPPSQFYEIQYEELVSDPPTVIRGMLEFLGLEWDDACLRHSENAKEVKTPSLWQVRQPMYSTSVERWRRYEPWLGGLSDLIELSAPRGDK